MLTSWNNLFPTSRKSQIFKTLRLASPLEISSGMIRLAWMNTRLSAKGPAPRYRVELDVWHEHFYSYAMDERHVRKLGNLAPENSSSPFVS